MKKELSFFEKWEKVIKKMSLGKRQYFSPELPPKNQIPPSERPNLKESGWDKVFEDELWFNFEIGWHTSKSKETLEDIVEKYLGTVFSEETNNKVKIKVRKGCIQIERIK